MTFHTEVVKLGFETHSLFPFYYTMKTGEGHDQHLTPVKGLDRVGICKNLEFSSSYVYGLT